MDRFFAIVIVLLASSCATPSSRQSQACTLFAAGKANLDKLVMASDHASKKYADDPTDQNLQIADTAAANAAQAAADLAVVEADCEASKTAP